MEFPFNCCTETPFVQLTKSLVSATAVLLQNGLCFFFGQWDYKELYLLVEWVFGACRACLLVGLWRVAVQIQLWLNASAPTTRNGTKYWHPALKARAALRVSCLLLDPLVMSWSWCPPDSAQGRRSPRPIPRSLCIVSSLTTSNPQWCTSQHGCWLNSSNSKGGGGCNGRGLDFPWRF